MILTLQFHIFECQSDGAVLWREAADSLEAARVRVNILAISSPGAYIVFNPSTGQKFAIGGQRPSAPGANKFVA